jgi:ABC-type multidrug transport system fused ATPase/permease subunit
VLFEPSSGKITIGGENVHGNLSKTRRTLSAVFQDFTKYETSIRKSITVSDTHEADDGELRKLCERTGAW